jgi:hypothetical protein
MGTVLKSPSKTSFENCLCGSTPTCSDWMTSAALLDDITVLQLALAEHEPSALLAITEKILRLTAKNLITFAAARIN